MLRSIGKQSGESVKSVKKKKREACFDLPAIGTLNLSVYFLASVNMFGRGSPVQSFTLSRLRFSA